ncbi:Protein kinase-like domain containing protein [Tylopilus felleus]
MPARSKKQAAEETAANPDQALLAQLERVFGDMPTNGELTEPELWWSQHYQWFKDSGYLLRPRYAPDWTPSWQGTKKSWVLCEDGCEAPYPTRILDGTRVSDGKYVALKLVDKTYHPHEIDIAQYLSSQPLATSANHCVPIYDVLPVPDEQDKVIIVMPLLQVYIQPPFDTIGEAVECFRQLFEGLHCMHKHHVAHRDSSSRNFMVDPEKLYLDAFHPSSTLMKRDFSGYARYKSRTERPPRYFLIDFGLSRRYDPSVAQPLEAPIWGADKEVPEFQNSNAPCNPFPTDVFYIGNTIRKDFVESKLGFDFMRPLITDMVQRDPSKRPTMDEVVERFGAIRAGLNSRTLRSRIISKGENLYQRVTRGTFHWLRQIGYITRGIPAIPTSP